MVTSGKLVLAVTTVSILASSIFSAAEAGDFHLPGQPAAPSWLPSGRIGANDLRPRPDVLRPIRPNLPNLPGNAGRPGNGGQPGNGTVTTNPSINNPNLGGNVDHPGNGGHPGNGTVINNHHHHGAIAAAAIGGLALGAIAVAAASHQDDCRYPVYNRRGRIVGYRWADCDYED
jgi:hypothetical protein